jgi:hypothetical protein
MAAEEEHLVANFRIKRKEGKGLEAASFGCH